MGRLMGTLSTGLLAEMNPYLKNLVQRHRFRRRRQHHPSYFYRQHCHPQLRHHHLRACLGFGFRWRCHFRRQRHRLKLPVW